MIRVALIDRGLVANVVLVEAGSPGHASLSTLYEAVIETDTAGPGWSWTQDGGFVAPATQTAPDAQASVLSRLEVLRRFTPEERLAIRSARAQSAELDDFMYLLESTATVRLDNADVVAGLALLEAGGLLATGRASEIMAG